MAFALLAGAGLSGCVADPYYNTPGYYGRPGYDAPVYRPQAYGPPGYAPYEQPGYGPVYDQPGFAPAYYPPVVVAPAIGIDVGGHRR